MPKFSVVVTGLCTTTLLATAAYAQSVPLNVKLGLWEMTTQTQMSGLPPIPPAALAHMAPEQRARIQASMAESMAKREKPEVRKECVTRKTLEHGFNPKRSGAKGCNMTVTTSTPRVMEMHQNCTGSQKITGTFHFEAPTPDTVVGNYHMAMSGGGNAMTMKFDIRGRWLGADCGNVKPADD